MCFFIVSFFNCKNETKRFYNNGNLKEIHYLNSKIDSSVYYIDSLNQNLKDVIIYNYESSGLDKVLSYSNGELIYFGFQTEKLQKVGKWTFKKKSGDSIVEFFNFGFKEYYNQFWKISKNKDTLRASNFYEIYAKDTVNNHEVYRFRIVLEEPYFSYNSDVNLLLPLNEFELENDFSNIYEIELDTIPSLKNDGISHPELPKSFPLNQVIEFGTIYEEKGDYSIKGVLVEYIEDKKALKRKERRMFFEKKIHVR